MTNKIVCQGLPSSRDYSFICCFHQLTDEVDVASLKGYLYVLDKKYNIPSICY